ncbi:MAG: hypothetical protein ACR2PI_11495 [Hyphomicrobiaceae bacterium]
MQYVCDAGELTWFRLETAAEAAQESQVMEHAVEKYFQNAYDEALRAYAPPASVPAMEQNIGRKAHIERTMPRFLTLRDNEGTALVTAMLPPEDRDLRALRPVIVAHGNSDPYVEFNDAIEALGRHVKLDLDRDVCFPYQR